METTNEEKNKGWGGKRAGAGRPKAEGTFRQLGLRIPEDVAQILDRQPNRTAYVVAAIRAYDSAQRSGGAE